MPVKSIIDIDVNDAAFKQFNALFQSYQKQLQSTPLQWRNIATAQQQGVKGFRDLVLEQAAAIGQQKLLNEAHKSALYLLRQEEGSWERIKRQTTGAATNIRDMTGQLLKWTSLTAVFSGLLGAGGLFGISRLTQNVSSGRRGSLGIGASYGQQKAFGTAFGRFVDPGSVLSGVEGALTDVTKRVALYGAGLGEKDLGGGSAAVSARLLTAAKRLADRTPDQLLGNVFNARRLGELGLTEDDFRRLKRTSAGELAQQQGRFGKLSGDYAVGSVNQRAYQDFQTALNDAGNQIETVFVKGIAPLVPGLTGLSGAVTEVVKNLLGNEGLKQWIDEAGKGLSEFAKYVGKPEFINAIRDFTSDVVSLAGSTRDFINFLRNPFAGPPKSQDYVGQASTWLLGKVHSGAHSVVGGLTGSLNIKPGAGALTPELLSIARGIQSSYPGFNRITAGEDEFHKGRHSAHNDGRAFDFTIKNPADSAYVADLVRSELSKQGIKGRVIDEYKNPSRGATGGHIHVQTDVKVMNAAGSNVIVSAQQVTPSP